VSTVVGGYSELSHLEDAVACSGKGPLPAEDMQRLQQVWQADFKVPA